MLFRSGAAIGAQHRAVQHTTARPHPDLATEYRSRGYVGVRIDRRDVLTVTKLHQPTVHPTLTAHPIRRLAVATTRAHGGVCGCSWSRQLASQGKMAVQVWRGAFSWASPVSRQDRAERFRGSC